MYRKAEKYLKAWKSKKDKKALLVTGARQIGKTYLVRKFGKANYKHFAEINFITTPSAEKIFQGDLNAETLVMNLTAFLGQSLEKGKTLIFLDEIQECPNARTAIKFLVEDGRFDYIESGSLLGVNYKTVPSYPVGFEEVLQMYPMDFEEFCIANNVQQQILDYLKECYLKRNAVIESIHDLMCDMFKKYIIVGGMPHVVQTFVASHDIGRVVSIQKDIVLQYRQDISKYAKDKKTKVTNIFDRIPSQLEDKNRRFRLSTIDTNARLRDYDDSFMWLSDAGVALPCYNLTEPKVPLKINEQSRLFKLFLNDTGLLCAMSMEGIQFDVLQGDVSVNMGGIFENVFGTQLKANGFQLRYLNKRSVGELDFVVQLGREVVPVEIKSSKDFRTHLSLNKVLSVKEWGIKEGIVFSPTNVKKDGNIVYLPWYMIMFLRVPSLDGRIVG